MKKIKINGNKELNGSIKISGAKNSAVALVPASLLSDGIIKIDNIPNISDIDSLNEILEFLGAKVTRTDTQMIIDSKNLINREIPEAKAKKLRASYYFMSALLGKYKHVEMYFPGGCSIGARPIDQTLKGFKLLGAKVIEEGNKFIIDAKELIGNDVHLDMPSVGATINTILVAVKAKGVTKITNAAREPEIVNVVNFLNQMGAKIEGAGSSEIIITGVSKLTGTEISVIPDRIEAGTYVILGALVGNKLKIENVIPNHIESLLNKLKEMNVELEINENNIIVSKSNNLIATNIKTLGFPGFPTDLQQPMTTLLSIAKGKSILEETIYENRFQNVPYLNEMGASIIIDKRKIYIEGVDELIGKDVVATDLRAGACLVLAGLTAKGKTTIKEVEHILRGYENLIGKLQNIGADIVLVDE